MKKPLSEEDLTLLLLNRAGLRSAFQDKTLFLYSPTFTQIEPEQQQQIDFCLAYTGLEEWFQALQSACLRPLSGSDDENRQDIERFKSPDLPLHLTFQLTFASPDEKEEVKAFLALFPLFEKDFARFLIERQIPIPPQLLENHPGPRSSLKGLPNIRYTKLDMFPTPQDFSEPTQAVRRVINQTHITEALAEMEIGQTVTIGTTDSDLLIHIPQRQIAQNMFGLPSQDLETGHQIPPGPLLEVTRLGNEQFKVKLLSPDAVFQRQQAFGEPVWTVDTNTVLAQKPDSEREIIVESGSPLPINWTGKLLDSPTALFHFW